MKSKIKIVYYTTPFGELIIGSNNDKLCLCDWRYRKMRSSIDQRIQEGTNAIYEEGSSEVINSTKAQLSEYFQGNRKEFDIPLRLIGSEFQQKVWSVLLQIPYGTAETYLSLSEKMGDIKAIRAVAAANGANAISIIVPCHRIVGADGNLAGYAGGLDTKRKLLKLENILINNQYSMF